jgi:hypothetical protein
MGLFQDIGEFFTGSKQDAAENTQNDIVRKQREVAQQGQDIGNQGAAQANEAIANLNKGADTAGQLAAGYNKGATDSMGANAAEYMQKANAAAQGQAEQGAQAGSTAAARQALGAARTAGVNRGQAAMQAGQQAGDTYTNNYQQGLNSGRQQYQQGANQFATQGLQQQALQQQGHSNVGQMANTKTAQGFNTALGGTSGAAGGSGALAGQASASGGAGAGLITGLLGMSDEGLKENIKPSIKDLVGKVRSKDPIKEVADNVKAVDFNYKADSGEDPDKQRVGVLAQDLEKTSMKDNVVDTPAGKAVDITQQTLSNTNLVSQLARRMIELEDELNKVKGVK